MDEETKQLIFQTAKNVETRMVDVGTLKSDVSTLKSDVSTLKSDVSTLKSDVKTLTLRSDVLEFNIDEMHSDMDLGFSLANDSFEKLTRHIDGFAAQSLRMDQELAAGLHRDDRLEDRILRLEQRPYYGR